MGWYRKITGGIELKECLKQNDGTHKFIFDIDGSVYEYDVESGKALEIYQSYRFKPGTAFNEVRKNHIKKQFVVSDEDRLNNINEQIHQLESKLVNSDDELEVVDIEKTLSLMYSFRERVIDNINKK